MVTSWQRLKGHLPIILQRIETSNYLASGYALRSLAHQRSQGVRLKMLLALFQSSCLRMLG